jgi:hypothetical protein
MPPIFVLKVMGKRLGTSAGTVGCDGLGIDGGSYVAWVPWRGIRGGFEKMIKMTIERDCRIDSGIVPLG